MTIKLDIPPSEAEKIYTDYLRLQGKSDIVKHFDELEPYIPDFLRFVDVMKNNKTDKVKIKEVLDIETALQIQYKRMADQFHEQMRGVNEPVNSKGQITNPKELKPKEGYSGMYFD